MLARLWQKEVFLIRAERRKELCDFIKEFKLKMLSRAALLSGKLTSKK